MTAKHYKFCNRTDRGTYEHFYCSANLIMLCFSDRELFLAELEVLDTPAKEHDGHCGFLEDQGELCLIQTGYKQLEMCFPGGIENSTRSGEPVALSVKILHSWPGHEAFKKERADAGIGYEAGAWAAKLML